VPSIQVLNTLIDQWDAADDARRIGSRARTTGELFAIEQPLLFAPGRTAGIPAETSWGENLNI
jgi:hypothetical protein